jgi:hypothetical protein
MEGNVHPAAPCAPMVALLPVEDAMRSEVTS